MDYRIASKKQKKKPQDIHIGKEFSKYAIEDARAVLEEFKSSPKGLNTKEIKSHQKRYGLNEIKPKEVSPLPIFFRQFQSSFVYLLLIVLILFFLLGEIMEAATVFIIITLSTGLGFYQEYRSEEALKFLKKYIVSHAQVRREGKEIIIHSKNLVPGDIIIVEAGDIIPADIRFFKENNLIVDEGILTGESVPVKKISKNLKTEPKEIYQSQNIGFSGTTVASGYGEGIIFGTGVNSVIGKISQLTVETIKESIFSKEITKFSQFILRLILIILIVVFFANIFIKGQEANIVNIVELLTFSIALTVSIIPEPLPVVTTISLSRGAIKLAKKEVVVKRLSAIEDLGSIEVLCSDKTGTLTENKLVVDEIYSLNKEECLLYGALLSPTLGGGKKRQFHDAFDKALWRKISLEQKEKMKRIEKISETPFDPERRRANILIKKGNIYELVVRGAPEILIGLCSNLDDEEKQSLKSWISKAGREGKRVIGIAKKEIVKEIYYSSKEEKNLSFLGVISFFDSIKKTTKEAMADAKSLGVKVKILTGDTKEVAGAVAYQIGLVPSPEKVISGDIFEKMSPDQQRLAVENYAVFSRVSPQQKYKIVKILQEENEVGFLGEGINDAPALKIANVALAVDNAADIARETSDIILLNRSLKTIIDGIQEGRKIFANTTKYIKSTLISNFGNFFALASASLITNFLPMLPLQILLLNFLSDFPMIAISTDNVDKEELKSPKSYNLREIVLVATILGFVSTVFDFIFFGLFYRFSPDILRTNWFIGSILTELILIFSIRSKSLFFKTKAPSKILTFLSGLTALFTIFLPFTRFGQEVFKFIPPQNNHLLWIFGVVLSYFIITESIKLIYYHILHKEGMIKS